MEYLNGTDPNDPDGDSDDDGFTDKVEIALGSHPNDGSQTPDNLDLSRQVEMTFRIGDWSGSRSERYRIEIFEIDPDTEAETFVYRLSATTYGEVVDGKSNRFSVGKRYRARIFWEGSLNEQPDYDWIMELSANIPMLKPDPENEGEWLAVGANLSNFKAPSSAIGVITDEFKILGEHSETDLEDPNVFEHEGQAVEFELVQVEVEVPKLNSDGTQSGEYVSADELKVGKMEDAVSHSPVGLNIDIDVDHFRIRIPRMAGVGNVSIDLSTENPNSYYNDDATEIEFEVLGNDLVTKTMLLVSNDDDDYDREFDIGENNQLNDRTHKVQLGGEVVIENLLIGEQIYPINIRKDVKIKKTVNWEVLIVKAHNITFDQQGNEQISLVLPITTLEMEGFMGIAQERYAQIGVQLVWSISVIDPPSYEAGVFDLTDGLNTGGAETEVTIFFDQKASASDSDLQMFIFNELNNPGFIDWGIAYFLDDGEPHENAIIINAGRLYADEYDIQSIAHEIGHVLTDTDHYGALDEEKRNRNIMNIAVYRDRDPGVNKGRRRFVKSQEDAMHAHPSAQ